ncbi:MAG: hypothetical protein GEU99_02305 [Luteitalea sp.]|nr:hypothetical protein [Luteitalea sp.]
MANWDADSPRLRRNLINVLRDARDRAVRRDLPTVEDARRWQRDSMAGLDAPEEKYVGCFRGEAGLESTRVWIGVREGVAPADVAAELAAFERTLQGIVAVLDARYALGRELDADGLAAVIDLCAWAHAEWVRIHPFANGNGRTARIWANALLMRYGLPPAVRLRPRPDGGYGLAGVAAMDGDWRATASIFRTMLDEALTKGGP